MKRNLLLVCLLPMLAFGQGKSTHCFAERDSSLLLDVWQPEVRRADSACVVALFGGGFVAGERDNELQTSIARLLTAKGFVVVSPDYRLGLKDSAKVASFGKGLGGLQRMFQWTIDIATEDCAAAVAYVLAHADELGVNPRRVVLTGSSAGAITVAQLDWCRANGLQQASSLPEGWMPAAVVPYAGAVMSKGKPRYATPPAPTMFLHGTKDKIVAYKRFPPVLSHALYGASTLFKTMKKAGHPVWMVRYKGIGHEVASFLPGSVDLFCGFVEQVFSGRVTTLDATMSDSRLRPTEWTNMNVFDLYK
ncbi:MAG: alpha/beta hydrolase [Bacteroidales bacterium]|nr:alpha/beta hydrolase [Bacteroidales bacterium]